MAETLTKEAPPEVEATAPPVPHALLSLCHLAVGVSLRAG